MPRLTILAGVFAALVAASVMGAEPDLDCEKMSVPPPGFAELIVSPATVSARDGLLGVLARAGLACVTRFRASGDCLVRYRIAGQPAPRIVASSLRSNIYALEPGHFKVGDQAFVGDVFVNAARADSHAQEKGSPTSQSKVFKSATQSKDPFFDEQKEIKAMSVELAWDNLGGSRPIVAVLDEGVWLEHPDLKDNLLPGITLPCAPAPAVCDGSPQSPDYGHGTAVAGVIGAIRGNDWGIAGAAANPQIIPINVGIDGGTDASNACGVEIAIRRQAKVINVSWVTSEARPELYKAMLAAPDDVVFVAAAGDGGYRISEKHPAYPVLFGLPNLIGVSDHGFNGEPFPSSNYSPQYVHITAQANAYTTLIPRSPVNGPNDGALYGPLTGETSFSTAYVSSMVALLKTRYPNWSHEWLKWRIIAGAIFSGRLEHMSESRGRLDFAAVMLPVTTLPGKVTPDEPALVVWRKGIRADMCPKVSIEARVAEGGSVGQYASLVASTANDGDEWIDARPLVKDGARQIQILVSCTNGNADALSPMIDIGN